jgi:hypothetical protein
LASPSPTCAECWQPKFDDQWRQRQSAALKGNQWRRPSLVVAVALANKTARIAWAVMHRDENYQCMAAAA